MIILSTLWWRHDTAMSSVFLALCAGDYPIARWFETPHRQNDVIIMWKECHIVIVYRVFVSTLVRKKCDEGILIAKSVLSLLDTRSLQVFSWITWANTLRPSFCCHFVDCNFKWTEKNVISLIFRGILLLRVQLKITWINTYPILNFIDYLLSLLNPTNWYGNLY